MEPNPSLRFKDVDFSQVIAFDYFLSTNTPTISKNNRSEEMISVQNIGQILQDPENYIQNLNINDPKLYFQEYSLKQNSIVLCLTKVFKPVDFQKIKKIGIDTG